RPGLLVQADRARPGFQVVVPRPLLRPSPQGDLADSGMEAPPARRDVTDMPLTPLLPEHWEAVARIYAEGIATGNSTFELDVPAWETWDAKHLAGHRIVAVSDAEVVGWAALSSVSERCVYAGVTEGSVYVAAAARGRGVG